MDKRISLRAQQASRVRLFLYQLGIFPMVFLIMMPVTLHFFGASPMEIPICIFCTVWILLATAWLSKKLLGSTDSDRPYGTTSDTD